MAAFDIHNNMFITWPPLHGRPGHYDMTTPPWQAWALSHDHPSMAGLGIITWPPLHGMPGHYHMTTPPWQAWALSHDHLPMAGLGIITWPPLHGRPGHYHMTTPPWQVWALWYVVMHINAAPHINTKRFPHQVTGIIWQWQHNPFSITKAIYPSPQMMPHQIRPHQSSF